MQMKLIVVFDIIGLAFAFTFLIIFLVLKERSNRSRYVMITGMLFALIMILENLLIVLGEEASNYVFLIAFPLLFTVYPILNIYLHSMDGKNMRALVSPYPFILPVVVFLSTLVLWATIDDHSLNILVTHMNTYQLSIPAELKNYVLIIYITYYLQFFYYLYVFLKLRKHAQNEDKSYQAEWIGYTIILIISYELLFMISWLLRQNFLLADIALSDMVILALGLLGLRHDDLLLQLQVNSSLKKSSLLNTERKFQSNISGEKAEALISELQSIIRIEHLYLNPGIRLKNFAQKLHIPEKELSILINDKLGRNFSAFINQFRIEEACVLLADPDIKISEIPFKVGFYSRSAFNQAFQNFRHESPSDFRKSIIIS